MTKEILARSMNLEEPYDNFVVEGLVPLVDKESPVLIDDPDCWDENELKIDVFRAKYFIALEDIPAFVKKLRMQSGEAIRPETYLNQDDICFLLEDAESMAGVDTTLKELQAAKAALQEEHDELDDVHSKLAEEFKQYKDDAKEDIDKAEEELHFKTVYEQALEDEKRALKAEEKKLRQKIAELTAMNTKRVQKGLADAMGAGEPADVIKLKNEKDALRAKNRDLNTEIEQVRLSLQRVMDQWAEIDEAAEEREFYEAIYEQHLQEQLDVLEKETKGLQEKLQESEEKKAYGSAAESKSHHKARHMEAALKRIHGDPEGLGELFYNLKKLAYEFNYEFSTGTFEPKWNMGGASLAPGKVLDSDGPRDMTRWEKIKEYAWDKITDLPLIGFPLSEWKRRFETWPSAKELSYFIKCIHKAFVEIEEKDPKYAMAPNRVKGYSIRDASEVFAENIEELRQKIIEEADKLGKPISDKNAVRFDKPAESGELKELYSALDALMQAVDYKPKEDTTPTEDGTHFAISPAQKYIDFLQYLGGNLTKETPESTKEAVAARKPIKEIKTLDEVFREPEEDAEMKTTLTPDEFFGDKKPEPTPKPEPKIESGRKVVTLEDFFGAEATEVARKTAEAPADKLSPEEMLTEVCEAAAEAEKAEESKPAESAAVDELLPPEAYTEPKTPVPERVEYEPVLEETMDEVVLEHSPKEIPYKEPEQAPVTDHERVYQDVKREDDVPAGIEGSAEIWYKVLGDIIKCKDTVPPKRKLFTTYLNSGDQNKRVEAYILGSMAEDCFFAKDYAESLRLNKFAYDACKAAIAVSDDVSFDKRQKEKIERNIELLEKQLQSKAQGEIK